MESCRGKLALVAGGVVMSLLASATPSEAQMAWTDRVFINANFGQQRMEQQIATEGTFVIYEETASWSAPFDIGNSSLRDISGGVRVWKNLAIGAGFSSTTDTHEAVLTATIPDVLAFNAPRSGTSTVTGLKREETAVHISAVWMVPVTDKIDIALSGGPSFFTVTQPFVSGMTVTPGASTIASVSTSAIDESVTGFHVAADVTFLIIPNVGVGAMARYAAAQVDAPALQGGSIDVGGLQGMVGLRIRF